ncbi:MAG: hypothetical protein ACTSUQ_03725 [Candidatus Freyarchaeota archaeon]
MSTDDVAKMMKDYREKALASRTRFQRFVDTFSLVPITVYFFAMVILVTSTAAGLTSMEHWLRPFLWLGSPTLLTDFERSVIIHLWFVPPIPVAWSQAPWLAAAVSVLVGFALFVVYFVSRRVAYGETYYLDLGFLAFFLLGLTLMFASPSLFATLYYHFPGTVIFSLLAIPALITTAVKRPFSLQHVERLFPPEIKKLDVYKNIHYAISIFWGLIFVVNAILGYITFYIPTTSPLWAGLFFLPLFFLIYGWAFMTHFPGWYTRRELRMQMQKPTTPLPRLVRMVGAALILFAVLALFIGLGRSSSAIGILEIVVAVTLMISGVGIILVKKWGWYLTIGGLLSYIALLWLGWAFPSVTVIDWVSSITEFLVNLSFAPPSEHFLFLAIVLSGISSVFLCYLFPKRNYYLAE